MISPLFGKTQSHIKNSTHFMQIVNSVCLRSDEMMVSVDVSSLFTNVPIDEAVSVIRDKLPNDESLDERTCLSPECITELLEVCLRSTYFRYNGNCYARRWSSHGFSCSCSHGQLVLGIL